MAENDPAQRYRDWLMTKGLIEHMNEAAVRQAQRLGLPEPLPRALPPPPPGSSDDLELKAAARKERARERRQTKAATRRDPKPLAVAPGAPPGPEAPLARPTARLVGRPRPGRAA